MVDQMAAALVRFNGRVATEETAAVIADKITKQWYIRKQPLGNQCEWG